jgi:methanethiol oxidase
MWRREAYRHRGGDVEEFIARTMAGRARDFENTRGVPSFPCTKESAMASFRRFVVGILTTIVVVLGVTVGPPAGSADETCNSPYVSKLIKGQEDYVYVWTLGVEGLGDGFDKLVTIDVNPKSKGYGKVVHSVSVGSRNEAHHMGFTDDRRFIWAGGLSDPRVFVFDIATNPAKPTLVRTIGDLADKTGYTGPHTYYAMPGRMLIQALSNTKDKGGVTGMALYNNKGEFIASYPMPTDGGGDGYGYDLAVNPKKNVLLTSSFTGYTNYMRPLGELVKDAEAMKRFGNTMVVWDLKALKPKQVLKVPGAPLEIRWSLNPTDNWAVTASALTSKLWLVKQDKSEWTAKEVATIGDPAKIPLPVDISITRDGKGLWVNTFMDGKTRYFDLSNPEAPTQTYEKVTGKQVNMISQSWDGKRVYITSSLLANWDKGGDDNEQFLRGFKWDGKELRQAFEVDFTKEKLGRAHHMKLGSKSLR